MNDTDVKLCHAIVTTRLTGLLRWGALALVGAISQGAVALYQLGEVRTQVEVQHEQILCLIQNKDGAEGECLR